MTGLVKAKKYDWKDSNMALFGSDTEKQVKKESAQGEPAWAGSGEAVGLKIWRIEKFEVKDWPEEDYGEFYSGDSYIILNTYKQGDSDALLYDVHFWIGKQSSQDEYGTAAYKTVELDTFHDGNPVQHREVEGHESKLFKSYFKNGITTMEGGCATGFKHVAPEEYKPKLFKFAKDSSGSIRYKEIPANPSLVVPGDVYILDLGQTVYQYNGEGASPMEVSKAMQFVGRMKSKRGEINSQVLDGAETSKSHEFFQKLDQEEGEDVDDDSDDGKKLLRVNVETHGTELVKEDNFSRDDLVKDDVFIVDDGHSVFVWIGSQASKEEKNNGFTYAHNYLCSSKFPWKSITVVKEGQKSALDAALCA